jgi:hypothetical protein
MNATPEIAGSTVSRKEQNGRVLVVVGRCLFVLAGAICAGALIHHFLTDRTLAINLAATGIAAGTIIAFMGDTVALMHTCAAYVRGEKPSLSDVAPAFWKSWASLTAIVAAILNWSIPTASANEPWMVIYSPGDGTHNREALYPVFYTNNADRSNWSTGISFEQAELNTSLDSLKKILNGLKHCGSAVAGTHVQLDVAGFASSKEFDGVSRENSNLLNVETANRRAWAAYCFVASHTPSRLTNADSWDDFSCQDALQTSAPALMIHVRRWPNSQGGFKQMMRERPLRDRLPRLAHLSADAEVLTRRVDFSLVDAGSCSIAPSDGPG